MSCDINVENAKVNSAQSALQAAQASYMQCLPVAQRPAAALNSVASQDAIYRQEAEQLAFMTNFLSKQKSITSNTGGNLTTLTDLANDTSVQLNKEIDDIKAVIRKEKRIFIDSDAQRSPAVGGLYFTLVPDNQILIAFMTCMCAFLLVISLLILFNMIPIMYFEGLTYINRIVTIAGLWAFALIGTYIGLYSFT